MTLLHLQAAFANGLADEFYASVEQHLRSLPSLEIGYLATGSSFPSEGLAGRLALQRPSAFYHDTPEWTHCETSNLQWRLLKEQQTLLLEDPQPRSEWSPEAVLLSLNRDLIPVDLRAGSNGDTILTLDAVSAEVSGQVEMVFERGRRSPKQITFIDDEGLTVSSYDIVMWHESVQLDSNLFVPPSVPVENSIDFRTP